MIMGIGAIWKPKKPSVTAALSSATTTSEVDGDVMDVDTSDDIATGDTSKAAEVLKTMAEGCDNLGILVDVDFYPQTTTLPMEASRSRSVLF